MFVEEDSKFLITGSIDDECKIWKLEENNVKFLRDLKTNKEVNNKF